MVTDQEPLAAKIPADVERPDKILYGLTGRQLAIMAGTGLLASWAYLAAGRLPVPAVAALVLPIIAAGVVLAVARRDGMSLDRFLLAAVAHLRTAKTRVHAPEGVQAPPGWCRVRGRLPAPLRLPVRAVRDDGVMELADGDTAVIVGAGTVTFALRTADEQAGLVSVFGRWLNSLDAPVQILVQARPVDLSGLVRRLTQAAPQLADPALEHAAHDHAAFMADLNASRDLLTRHVLIVIRGEDARPRGRKDLREADACVVLRRAEEAVRSLTALGVRAGVLDAAACTALLAESLSPGDVRLPEVAGPEEPITVREVAR
ncbi:PrgI family protein [Actinomadura craniellae]|nr:PrgI family protein [Actinomadura craniellae]